MRRASFVLYTVALLLGARATAAQQLDEYIREQMQRQNIPGLSVAVLKDGKILEAKGYGFSDLKAKTPATAETVYQIGSVSKQFLATGTMLLVQSGKLRLDDSITRFLDGAPAAWNPITIRHLLTHTGGLVREAPGFDMMKRSPDADVIRSAYSTPLRFAPGEKWEYSNLGYFILAEIIHRVSDQPWSDYLRDNVFRPVGMTATRTTTMRDSVPNHARGYSDNEKLLDAPDWIAVRPSGAFISTILDLAKWEAALHTNDILTEETRRQMWTPVTLTNGQPHPYGLGWHVTTRGASRVVWHGGGLPGFVSHYTRHVDSGLTVIVLTNLDDLDIGGLVNGIVTRYLQN
jgi:CubicO group peptidase (beta-lactamase class C family)